MSTEKGDQESKTLKIPQKLQNLANYVVENTRSEVNYQIEV